MSKKTKENVLFAILFLPVFIFMDYLTSPNLFTITDAMEKEVGLIKTDVTKITLTKVSREENDNTLTGADIDKMMVYLGSTVIEKSRRKFHTIDGPWYNIVLYTDEKDIEFGRSKLLRITKDSGKTYIQLMETNIKEKVITYETEDNGLYDLVLTYLK